MAENTTLTLAVAFKATMKRVFLAIFSTDKTFDKYYIKNTIFKQIKITNQKNNSQKKIITIKIKEYPLYKKGTIFDIYVFLIQDREPYLLSNAVVNSAKMGYVMEQGDVATRVLLFPEPRGSGNKHI
jgi:hypothetical protein